MAEQRQKEPLLSAVVPFLNEEECIPALIRELHRSLSSLGIPFELVLVDDGSKDRSAETAKIELRKLRQVKATVISLSRNFGKEAALTAGLEASHGDIVVPLDADLQDPPDLIEEMVHQWREGYDVVYAVRRQREGESKAKRFTAYSFYRLMGRLSKIGIPADTGDFRLMDRSVVDALLRLPERSRFMKGLFAWVGYKQTAIYYDRAPRKQGKTSWDYWRLWNFAIDGVTSFSRIPLQVWSYAGLAIAILSLGYGAWMVLRTVLFGVDLPGYASLMTAVMFLGGIQLVGLGVVGEYVGRIFEEVKRRPLYLVRDTWSSDSLRRVDTRDRTNRTIDYSG